MPTIRNPRRGNATVISKLDAPEKRDRDKEKNRQIKERMEAEMENAQKMEEQRLKRYQKKKERDELRKREEAERKRIKDKAKQTQRSSEASEVSPEIEQVNRPDPKETTAILSRLNQGQAETDGVVAIARTSSEVVGEIRSPEKRSNMSGREQHQQN
jgi:hypothetical protein